MKRRAARTVCRAMLGLLLFTQLALSVYACPAFTLKDAGSQPRVSTEVAAPAPDPTRVDRMAVDCVEMAAPDRDFVNLCDAHCRYGQQSDHAAQLMLPGMVMIPLYPAPLIQVRRDSDRPVRADASGPWTIESPPHAIAHCCFRI